MMSYELNGYTIKWDCKKNSGACYCYSSLSHKEQKICQVIEIGWQSKDGDYVLLCQQQINAAKDRRWGWTGGVRVVEEFNGGPRLCQKDRQPLSQVEVSQYRDLCTSCYLQTINV